MRFDLPQDLAIPHLDIYSKDTSSYSTDTCSNMSIIAQLIIVRHWKQPRCLSREGRDKESMVVHFHNGLSLSH